MDDRDDVATLLGPRPNRPLPQPDAQRTALLTEMRAARRPLRRFRVPAPMLAAGAVAATLVVVAVGTTVTGVNDDRPIVTASAPATTFDELLRRVDAAAPRQPQTVVGANQFLYLRSLDNTNLTPGEAARNREEWHAADGALFGLREGNATTLDVYDSAEQPPATMPALDAAILYPDPARLTTLTTVEPAALLTAINRLSAPGAPPAERAFDRVQTILTNGGLAFPRVRAQLYHVAALIPGVEYRPDAVDLLGRNGAMLAYGNAQLIVDPSTGALLGRRGTAFQRYATVGRIGERPEGTPVGSTPPEKPGDRTVRGLDYANESFVVPVDAHFGTASYSDESSLPLLEFSDGVATRRDAAGRTIRYEMVFGRPVGFANLLGRIEGPLVLLRVHVVGQPVAQSAWAVLFMDFSHAEGFPTKLVTWLDPGPRAVSVTTSGTTVTVTPDDGPAQRYRWADGRFAKTN